MKIDSYFLNKEVNVYPSYEKQKKIFYKFK